MHESPSPKPPRWPCFKKEATKTISKRRAAITWVIIISAGALTPLLYFGIGRDHPLVIKALPDPFVFNNGSRVSNAADWDARRAEIKALLLGTEYGTMPGRPDQVRVTETSTSDLGGGRTLHAVTLTIIPDNATLGTAFNASAWIYVPNGTGPFPAVIRLGKDGDGFNVPAMDRGYMFACFNHKDLDPDTEGHDVIGPAQLAYPDYSWGSISVWAWGAMRLADYLLGAPWVNTSSAHVPSINASVLAITGHSRTGKAALLAGGLDERFTMVVPNGSGCGGAGSFLVQGPAAETIALITSKTLYKSWFKADFNQFAFNEAQLTFDQHFLRALVAPRVMLSTDSVDDWWANPVGTQAIYDASMPVFHFLNASVKNGIHYRTGEHEQTQEDFHVLLDFADMMFRGITISGDFYMRPFTFSAPVAHATSA